MLRVNHLDGFAVAAAVTLSGYSTEASQFIVRITDPGTTRKNAYAAIIDSLVANGIWTKLDCLWIMAADIQANALINLKASSFSLTLVNTPVFTADQGFKASASNHRINTSFNSTTASSPFYTQNSAHFSLWNRFNTGTTNFAIMGTSATGATGESHIFCDFGGTSFYGRINESGAAAYGDAVGSAGFFLTNRSSSTATQGYLDGSAVGAGVTATSATPFNGQFYILGAGDSTVSTGTAGDEIAVVSIGGSLTAGEVGNFYTALNSSKWW